MTESSARPWLSLICFAVVLAFSLWFRIPGREPGRKPLRTTSGAMQALNLWAAVRAYPHPVIPDVGHALAYQQARELQRGAAGPTHPIDELVAPWVSLGPANIGGRTLALALRPDNPDVLFAGSANGGLWKSTTGGVGADAWDYVETGFPVLAVSAIAIDPVDPNVMYIGTGEVYRYQSAIGGEVDRTTRGSYGIGILKSTDGGATWSHSLDWSYSQTRGVWGIAIHPTNPAVVYAATTEGVYKSLDAGGSWSLSLGVLMATDLRIHPTSPETVLVACGNFASPGQGLYRTLNGGANWTKLSLGLPTSWSGKAMIDMAPINPNVVYASISNAFIGIGLYRSFDLGLNWSRVNTADVPQYQGWYSHWVLVGLNSVNTVLTGGIDIWKSGNGGTTLAQVSDWSQIYLGTPLPGEPGGTPDYAHADQHFALRHPTNPNVVFFASDGGVFKTTDGGDTFIGLNGGYVTTQFYQGFSNSALTPNFALGGMQDNLSAIYEGSIAWRRVIGGDGNWAAVNPLNDSTLYGTAQVLTLFRSYDRGENWTEITPPTQPGDVTAFVAPFVLCPSDTARLYAGRSKIYRSDNGGSTWIPTSGGALLDGSNPVFSLAVSPTNADVVYATTAPNGSRGKVFRTTNGGGNWTNITGTLPDRYPLDVSVDPTNDHNVFIAFGGFGSSHVFRSQNRGDTWIDMGDGLPDVPVSVVEVDPAHPAAVYVGTDLGVYYSPYYGLDWYPFQAGMPTASVNDLKVVGGGSRRIRAITHGNGVYERDLLELQLSGSPEGEPTPSPGLRLRVEPNPLRAHGRIAFTLRRESRVRLALYDVSGRQALLLLDETRGVGEHAVSLTPNGVASGVYFVKLEAEEGTTITRVVFLD